MNKREIEREIAACTARTSARAAHGAGDLVKINNELGILMHTGVIGVFGITWYALMSNGKIEHWHGCDIKAINENR